MGALALIVASILWGTTGTAASFVPSSVSPLAIGASTMGIGGAVLFLTSPRVSASAIRDAASRRWLAIGAIGVVIYPLAFYSSMNLAGVAIGNVVSLGTGPVFAAILEWVVERRRLSVRWAVSAAVAVVGIVLLSLGGHGAASTGQADVVPGVLLGLLAGFAYALFTYASSRAIRAGASSRSVMGAMFGLGAVGLLPVLAVLGAPILESPLAIGIAAYLALGPMALAYVFFGIGMRSLRSSAATTITLLEPVVATVLAVAVVGERLEPLGWVGLALILVGVTVVATASHEAESGSRA